MAKNNRVRIYITPLQNQLIIRKAEQLGYTSKAAFARAMILENDFSTEKMIKEIYEMVCWKNSK